MPTLKMKIEMISLSEIQIPTVFIERPPKQEKLDAKKTYIQKHGKLEQPLIVHPDTKQLVDGWAGYLAMKELGKNTAQVEWGIKKRPQPTRQPENLQQKPNGEITQETKIAVWEAEDGRCEVCKRAMDKHIARVCRVDGQKNDWGVDNLHLLCIDCKERKPNLLAHVSVPDAVGKELAPHFLMSEEETIRLLPELLRLNGVIVRNGKLYRVYWLPGVGIFHVSFHPKPEVTKIARIDNKPRIKNQPQTRTRGLPKPWFTRKDVDSK